MSANPADFRRNMQLAGWNDFSPPPIAGYGGGEGGGDSSYSPYVLEETGGNPYAQDMTPIIDTTPPATQTGGGGWAQAISNVSQAISRGLQPQAQIGNARYVRNAQGQLIDNTTGQVVQSAVNAGTGIVSQIGNFVKQNPGTTLLAVGGLLLFLMESPRKK